MNREESINKKYHYLLISSYLYKKALYSFSFKKRILIDLGDIEFQIRSYDKDLDVLSDNVLENKIDSLKAPWWNELYTIINKNQKILFILKIIVIQKDFSIRSMKLIYKILKSKET